MLRGPLGSLWGCFGAILAACWNDLGGLVKLSLFGERIIECASGGGVLLALICDAALRWQIAPGRLIWTAEGLG